jgi:hypothetical protein
MGRRFGGPKHNQPHPSGGTWGGHLVRVFREVFPGGPVRLLGEPLVDHPELPALADPGQGPAVALVRWAENPPQPPLRWWVVATDQVLWTAESLLAWHQAAEQADPEAERWVVARTGDHVQYLGGFLASVLVPGLAGRDTNRLRTLVAEMPNLVIPWAHDCWVDLDTPEDHKRWLEPSS